MGSIFEYRQHEAERVIEAADAITNKDPQQTRILTYRPRRANDHSPLLEAYVSVPHREYAIKLSAVTMSDRRIKALEDNRRAYGAHRPVILGSNGKPCYAECMFILDGVMSAYKAADSEGSPDPDAWRHVEIVIRETEDSESYITAGDLYDFLRVLAEDGVSRNSEKIVRTRGLTHE